MDKIGHDPVVFDSDITELHPLDFIEATNGKNPIRHVEVAVNWLLTGAISDLNLLMFDIKNHPRMKD